MTHDADPAAPLWAAIDAHAAALRARPIRDLLADPERLQSLTVDACGLTFDFAKEKLDAGALALLGALARAQDLEGWRDKLFAGEKINTTEGRAVLHTALRQSGGEGEIAREVAAVRARMAAFAGDFRAGRLRGATGQALDAIVHIGIGGSDLGPRLIVDALKGARAPGLTLRFAANVDAAEIADALEGLDPARTLVVVASKTFTTLETMRNAETARAWLRAGLNGLDVASHLVAVTAAPARAGAWGVGEGQVFPFWDWVGGRYSLWSAVGLSSACVLEAGAFEGLLAGAAAMDLHFRTAPLSANAPVLSAFVHVWNRAALGAASYACAPYARRLQLLPAFLQQLEMESNGKGVTRAGAPLTRPAAGVTWGEPGTNGQHSFFQMLHQGLRATPVEFLIVADGQDDPPGHRTALLANALAQAEALLIGKGRAEVEAELAAQGLSGEAVAALAPHKVFPGDRGSTLIGLPALTPEALGALLAFYEHRTFVQGVLMGINSFDQWGVELGKQLATALAAALDGPVDPSAAGRDPSTAAWIARLRR